MYEAPRINAIAAPAPSGLPSRPFLGVLTLDTRFPRVVGDLGNPASFPMPALTRVVRGAEPVHVVRSAAGQRSASLLSPFRKALLELQAEGAAAITTSCGFLVLLQDELQAAAQVPVVTSSLLLLPDLLEQHAQVGVLTSSAEHLGPEFLIAAGVPPGRLADVLVEGVAPEGAFSRCILGNEDAMMFDEVARDVVDAAARLHRRAPHLTDVVLECTNMPPYAARIEQETGLRTWSLLQSRVLLAPFHLPH